MPGDMPDPGRGGLFALAPGLVCDDVVNHILIACSWLQPLASTMSRVPGLGTACRLWHMTRCVIGRRGASKRQRAVGKRVTGSKNSSQDERRFCSFFLSPPFPLPFATSFGITPLLPSSFKSRHAPCRGHRCQAGRWRRHGDDCGEQGWSSSSKCRP